MASITMKWWKAAGIRALKTFAQTLVSTIGVNAAMTIGEVDWIMVLSASALSAIMSLGMSIAGLPELKEDEEDADA